MKRPNFFIAGAPRCGTSSLWRYLKDHPDIFMSAKKELYFFDSDLRPGGSQSPPIEQYLANFAAAGNSKMIGEATPSYLRSERAPTNIKAFSPEARIIIMLRNPVDVMHSLHSAALYDREPLSDFEAAFEADAERRVPELIGYREFTNFPKQVGRYLDVFGRSNVHFIIFDDLKANPALVYRDTLRFLGVNTSGPLPEFEVVNPNANVRNLRLHRNLARPPGVLRDVARALLPPPLRSRIKQALLKSNRVTEPRAPIDPEVRRRLQKQVEPQVQQLTRLLGRDLSGWSVESGR